jgi:HSP20 family protein
MQIKGANEMNSILVRRPFGNYLLQMANSTARTDVRMLEVPFNVMEHTEGYVVSAVIPGLKSEEIDINLANNVLTISGEIKPAELPEGARFHLREQATGRFERSLKFNQAVDANGVEASYEAGILTLRLPKAEEAKPRKISVQ